MDRLFGLIICIFLVIPSFGQLQPLDEVKLDGLFLGTLTEVLDQFTNDTGIKFSFDRAKFSKFKYENRLFDLAVSEVLIQIGKQYKLKYYQDDTGTVYLLDQSVLLNEKVISERPTTKKKQYTGDPTRTNFTITGVIKDKITGESLPYANIEVKGTAASASANVDGYFSLLKVPSDTVTIVLKYLGYDPTVIQMNPDTKTQNIIIEMEQATVSLDAVFVSSQKEQTTAAFESNEKVGMTRLAPTKLMVLPNAGQRDIFRSFQLMPGVSASNQNSAGLYVRGGTPDQALVQYDGFTVYNVDHLFGFNSAFNYHALKEVQFYKGGFDSKYGGRLSSAAILTGKEGNQRQFNMGGDVSLMSFNVYGEMPLGDKVTAFVAFRRSWSGPLFNKVFDSFITPNSAPTNGNSVGGGRNQFANQGNTVSSFFYDVNSKVTFRPTDKDIISWSLYNGRDNMDNTQNLTASTFFANANLSYNSRLNDVTTWGNLGTSLKWSREWSSKFYSNTLVSYSNYYSHRDRSNYTTITKGTGELQDVRNGTIENNNIYDFSIKTDLEYKFSDHHSLEFGGMTTQYNISYNYALNDTAKIVERYTKASVYTGYAQAPLHLFKNSLLLTPGLRYNYYDVTQQYYSEPRFSFNYAVNQRITFKGATGRYYQFVKRVIREDLLTGSRDIWALADGNKVPISYANHFILGASYETPLFLFDVEAYYKQLYGLSEYSLRFTPTLGNVNFDENFYQGTGETRGIDFLMQKKSGSYNGWIGYTLSQTTNTFPSYQEKPYLASQNVMNEFKFINMYKYHNWDFSLSWFYATGRPYTAPDGAYTVTLVDGTTNNLTSVSTKNGLRLPDTHRMDLAVTYHWTASAGGVNSVGLSFFNLYNQKNIWYKDYQIVAGKLVETNVYYLGFTPNLTVSMKLK